MERIYHGFEASLLALGLAVVIAAMAAMPGRAPSPVESVTLAMIEVVADAK